MACGERNITVKESQVETSEIAPDLTNKNSKQRKIASWEWEEGICAQGEADGGGWDHLGPEGCPGKMAPWLLNVRLRALSQDV